MKEPQYSWICLFCNKEGSEEPYAEATIKDKRGNAYSGYVCKDCFLRGLHEQVSSTEPAHISLLAVEMLRERIDNLEKDVRNAIKEQEKNAKELRELVIDVRELLKEYKMWGIKEQEKKDKKDKGIFGEKVKKLLAEYKGWDDAP